MGCSAGPSVASAPVLYLDAGNSKSYPATGTTWTDLSGNGNHGTLVNGPTYDAGYGGSLVFDGVNDYADCGNSTIINFGVSQSFTVAYWVYSTAMAGYEAHVAKSSGNGWIPNLLWAGATPQLRWWLSSNVPVTYNSLKPYLNAWRYVAMSIDRSINTAHIFEDGVLVASASISSSLDVASNANLWIGNDVYGSAASAKISAVQIYNRQLTTAAEVRQNFNAMRGRYGL